MKKIIAEIVSKQPIKIIISKPRQSDQTYHKLIIRNIMIKGEEQFQIESFTKSQVFHTNVKALALIKELERCMNNEFKQCDAFTPTVNYCVRISKKGKVSVSQKRVAKPNLVIDQEHNRKKNYLIPEGTFIEPLYDLGVFTKEGKVVHSMYDKYKQINRFIEMIDDCITLDMKQLNIIDFGCGKSYLTFILYYYLRTIKKIDVHMVGLDLKEDVIKKCNQIAQKYQYDHLHFEMGNIKDYHNEKRVDMVLSLHACDIATDYALYNAIRWNAKMIFSVPCCQHEVNAQMKSQHYPLFTRYGLLKERMAALVTDEIRANLLVSESYKVQVLEFIELSHSPKNILLRCIKSDQITQASKLEAKQQVEAVMKEFTIEQTLYTLLKKDEEQ